MKRFRVADWTDVLAARVGVRDLARRTGFGRKDAEEVCIVASELGSNIVKYGIQGEIAIEAIDDADRGPGVRIAARDQGPPFRSFETALLDGCDDRGPILPEAMFGRAGIGAGLGAVVRFTDELAVHPAPAGKEIVAVRWLRRPKPGAARAQAYSK